MLPHDITAEARVLFHDTQVEDIDPELHAPFVMARVLDRGTLRSVRALLRYYGQERIRSFLVEGGLDRISPRTVPLWTAFLKLPPGPCTPKSSPPRRTTSWSA